MKIEFSFVKYFPTSFFYNLSPLSPPLILYSKALSLSKKYPTVSPYTLQIIPLPSISPALTGIEKRDTQEKQKS